MGQSLGIPGVDTRVATATDNATVNAQTTRDSVITSINIAGDTFSVATLLVLIFVLIALYYLHKSNILNLHTRLNNLAQLTGIGPRHHTEPEQALPLKGINV